MPEECVEQFRLRHSGETTSSRSVSSQSWNPVESTSRTPAYVGVTNKSALPYGIYIYAYPVQQAVSQVLAPDLDWLGHFAITYPITLIFAIASWHWIESPTWR